MKRLQTTAILIATLLLAACTTFRPRLGMSYNEWRDNWARSFNNWTPPRMVAAQGDEEVWTFGDGVYYYFVDGSLVKMDQGQLMQQRIQVEVKKD
ncbi:MULTISPECIES: hypothetical protein [unclassified Rhodanobacter]|uniref:Lipoprotein n=1 Tax=Rhodanobacter humi TaxID=1888173 RepID=A0ABV4AP93_9GAMM